MILKRNGIDRVINLIFNVLLKFHDLNFAIAKIKKME